MPQQRPKTLEEQLAESQAKLNAQTRRLEQQQREIEALKAQKQPKKKRKLIPRPKGEPGRGPGGYNLRKEMRLGDKKHTVRYNRFLRISRGFANAYLPTRKKISKQKKDKVDKVVGLIAREVKLVRRYQGAWPARAAIKQYLRNCNTKLKRDLENEEEAAKGDGEQWDIPDIRPEIEEDEASDDDGIDWVDDNEEDDEEDDDECENEEGEGEIGDQGGAAADEEEDETVGDLADDLAAEKKEDDSEDMQEDLFEESEDADAEVQLHAASWGGGDEKENHDPSSANQVMQIKTNAPRPVSIFETPLNGNGWTPSGAFSGKIKARRTTVFESPSPAPVSPSKRRSALELEDLSSRKRTKTAPHSKTATVPASSARPGNTSVSKFQLPVVCPAPHCNDPLPQKPSEELLSLLVQHHNLLSAKGLIVGANDLTRKICYLVRSDLKLRNLLEDAHNNGWPNLIDLDDLRTRISTTAVQNDICSIVTNAHTLSKCPLWTRFLQLISYKVYAWARSDIGGFSPQLDQAARCGYFGPQGKAVIVLALDQFLWKTVHEQQISMTVTALQNYPQPWDSPRPECHLIPEAHFVHYLLAPFVAAILIAEDMGVDFENAIQIMDDSSDYGDVINPGAILFSPRPALPQKTSPAAPKPANISRTTQKQTDAKPDTTKSMVKADVPSSTALPLKPIKAIKTASDGIVAPKSSSKPLKPSSGSSAPKATTITLSDFTPPKVVKKKSKQAAPKSKAKSTAKPKAEPTKSYVTRSKKVQQ